jgi:hypothetical protein
MAKDLILEELRAISKGTYLNEEGAIYKGIHVFNAPIGEPDYVPEMLEDKAHETHRVINTYASDLADNHAQELWTILQYSLYHMITY